MQALSFARGGSFTELMLTYALLLHKKLKEILVFIVKFIYITNSILNKNKSTNRVINVRVVSTEISKLSFHLCQPPLPPDFGERNGFALLALRRGGAPAEA